MSKLLEIVRHHIESGRVTVSGLASVCGCSREYIYKMLREDSHPTMPIAEKLAGAVGVEITLKTVKRKKNAI